MIGRTIGGYRIESLLGQGGMGSVYRGTDLMLDRPVAIKALRADVAASKEHVERFRQEAKTLARLLDPNIATLYALLREGDDLYMVMEFVEGETFEALLARERWLPADRALEVFDQALRGIAHAHRRGIVHRDVKPANFMVMPNGTVKVMDFGIARLLGSARMTQTRHAIGTAEYMAPEQVRAREVDARTDVYALGVLLYELVTGRVPFEAESAFEVMQAHLQTPAPSPRRLVRDLPDGIVEAIVKAMAKDPDDRFESVEAFRTALFQDAPSRTEPTSRMKTPQPVPQGERTSPVSSQAGNEPSDFEKTPDPEPNAPSTASLKPASPRKSPLPTGGPSEESNTTLEGESSSADPEAERPAPPPTVAAPALEAGPPPTRISPSLATPPTIEVARRAAPETVAATIAPQAPPSRTIPRRRIAIAALATVAVLASALGISALLPTTGPTLEDVPAEETTTTTESSPFASAPFEDAGTLALENEAAAPVQPINADDPDPGPTSRPDSPAAETRPAPSRPEPQRAEPQAREPVAQRPEPRPTPPAAPQVGTARILVRPFGDVYVDGRRLARETNAPVTTDLEPGTYTVRATHPVFGELTETVRVRAGRTAEVRLQFATPADVTVTSDVLNAEILLDGRRTGRYTPAVVSVPPGTHTLTAERDGRTSNAQTVTVATGRSPGAVRLTFPD